MRISPSVCLSGKTASVNTRFMGRRRELCASNETLVWPQLFVFFLSWPFVSSFVGVFRPEIVVVVVHRAISCRSPRPFRPVSRFPKSGLSCTVFDRETWPHGNRRTLLLHSPSAGRTCVFRDGVGGRRPDVFSSNACAFSYAYTRTRVCMCCRHADNR